MSNARTALIVGAGIGGLAAGLALRRVGWRVQIHERAASPRELGFALALAPNAMAALGELGLADTLLAEGAQTTKAELRRTDGRVLRRFETQVGGPLVIARRTALHGALLQAVGSDALVLGSEAVDATTTAAGVSLRLTTGETADGDVLIAADGVGSVIRARLHPQEPPARPSGFCALRGLASGVGHHLGDLAAVGYFGDGVEAATVRAGRDAVYWYVSLLAGDIAGGPADARAILTRHTAGFDPAFHAIAAASGPDDLRFDALFVRDPLPAWGTGRITLLGDAAHPVLPHTGQGAAMALEDAVALGLVLRGQGDVGQALRTYERVRQIRTQRLVKAGPRIARVTTTHHPLVQALRTAAIRWLPESILVASALGPGGDPHRELR